MDSTARVPGTSPGLFLPRGHATAITIIPDTHVIMEMWLWNDPRCRPILKALEKRVCCFVRSRETTAELASVISREQFGLSRRQACMVICRWRRIASNVEAIRGSSARCLDSGDQKFLDLAASASPSLLVTRDRLLLRCRARALKDGVTITTPETAAGLFNDLLRTGTVS